MKSPKISVIIPVYNVEPYLRKCLDSVINQTYRNLEIILVDDGSPDNCGAICDEYAAKDDRITVIHKENGGLSSARNAGLDIATGDYLGFVDSDDWIEPDMYEYLLDGSLSSNTDIVQCSISVDTVRGSEIINFEQDKYMDSVTALGELLKNREVTNNAVNKLFSSFIFSGIRFPDGRVYEDISIMYLLFDKAKQVLFRPNAKYHYIMRSTGIVLSERMSDRMDCWTAVNERYRYMQQKYPQFRELLTVDMMGAIMDVWSVVWRSRIQLKTDYRPVMAEMANFARAHYKTALRYGNFGITGRIRLCLTRYNSKCAYFLANFLHRAYSLKFS